jgi:hypothetical protein
VGAEAAGLGQASSEDIGSGWLPRRPRPRRQTPCRHPDRGVQATPVGLAVGTGGAVGWGKGESGDRRSGRRAQGLGGWARTWGMRTSRTICPRSSPPRCTPRRLLDPGPLKPSFPGEGTVSAWQLKQYWARPPPTRPPPPACPTMRHLRRGSGPPPLSRPGGRARETVISWGRTPRAAAMERRTQRCKKRDCACTATRDAVVVQLR